MQQSMVTKVYAGAGLLFSLLLISTMSIAQLPQKPPTKPLEQRLPQRPNSPKDLRVIKRAAHYLKIGFTDSSDNELGNRLYRSVDGIHWDLLRELGVLNVGRKFEYTDPNLAHTTLYYYKVEVYARTQPVRRGDTSTVRSFTPVLAAYTGEGDSIRLFRLQVYFKTADFPNADLDGPLRVDVGIHRGYAVPAKIGNVWIPESDYTFINYGHNDFERGSEFTYDLIVKDIHTLDQLGDIKISNTTWDDSFIMEAVKVIANNNVVYERSYGAAGQKIVGLGSLVIPFSAMASSTAWQTLVDSSRHSLTPPGLDVILDQTTVTWTVKIPRAEITSRIECIIGHALTAVPSMRDNLEWDESYHAVTVRYMKPDSLHVDLDLRTTTGIDRNLDVDFELGLAYSCDQRNRLKLVITPTHITSQHHFDLLNGLLPAFNFVLKIAYDIAAHSQGTGTVESIESIFDLPPSLNCSKAKCMFSPAGDLLIILSI